MECNYRPVERAGLYIMVFIILLSTCDISTYHKKVMEKFKDVENRIELIEKGDCYETDILDRVQE